MNRQAGPPRIIVLEGGLGGTIAACEIVSKVRGRKRKLMGVRKVEDVEAQSVPA